VTLFSARLVVPNLLQALLDLYIMIDVKFVINLCLLRDIDAITATFQYLHTVRIEES
jgi:hypothetical protein